MTQALFERVVCCPYCGEWIECLIDITAADSEYTEDCQVCCRPIVFAVGLGAMGEEAQGEVEVSVRSEDETL